MKEKINIELKPLTANDDVDIYNLLQEIPPDENGFINRMCGSSFYEYKQWLIRCAENAQKTEIEDGWKVPQSVYWLYVDDKPVGMGKVRHCLTEKLRREGGNVGYSIRPSERCKGYGTILLQELIAICKAKSIPDVILTIHNSNTASIKVALKNGGTIDEITPERHIISINCKDE